MSLFYPKDETLETVIKETESLFKTREKEYQDTIGQIEVRLFQRTLSIVWKFQISLTLLTPFAEVHNIWTA